MRMGHAMIRPAGRAIFSEERHRLKHLNAESSSPTPISAASPIFEEAQYHGVEAPKKC